MGCNCGRNNSANIRRRDLARKPVRITPPVSPIVQQNFSLAPQVNPVPNDGKTLTNDRRRIDALRREAIRRHLGIG